MRSNRWCAVVAVVVCLAASACSSSGSDGDAGLGGATTSTTKTADVCAGKTLEASEVGITPTTITVTVMADVGSPLSLGLFQGSIDAVNAWAQYVNDNGGLACRKVVIKTADSKLSPDEAKNGATTACGNSLALVGTTALFLNDMRPLEGCKDKAGAATGLPDLATLQTEPVEQCSPVSFSAVQQGAACPYSGAGVRDFVETTSQVAWFKSNVEPDLHGVFVLPPDLPSTISASTPVFAALQKQGIKLDKQFGISALATQSQYTPVVQAIKASGSNWVINSADAASNAKLRKEAAAQGVTGVKVWACVQACYSPAFLEQAGPAAEGQYAWISFLPLEYKGVNPMLDTFLKYDKKPDAFGLQAFTSGLLIQEVIEGIVKKDGPNGITRAAILAGLRGVHDFDAGGMIANIDVANRKATACIVVVQVQQGKWVQVDPEKKGTFDCDQPNGLTQVSLDPVKAYKPS